MTNYRKTLLTFVRLEQTIFRALDTISQRNHKRIIIVRLLEKAVNTINAVISKNNIVSMSRFWTALDF